MSKRFLVIGSNSFSGACFVDHLLGRDCEVLGASRSAEPLDVFLPYKWGAKRGHFSFRQIDINHQLDELLGWVEELKPEYVVNFAAQGMVAQSWLTPEHWYQTNVVGQVTNALDTMLECAEAMKDDPWVHFLVVGEGDLRAHYQRKYAHLSNLTFAPRVPKQMVQSVLSHCDLLYFSVHVSTVWKYGQSLNKVIDYMLAGKPVVASYTGFPSMINEADCGTYVPAGDVTALRREVQRYAAMDAAQREAIGRRGREWILAHRRYDTLARNYLAILFGPTEAEVVR